MVMSFFTPYIILTSSLQEDDTTHMLTKVCHKFLAVKKE